MSFCAKYLGGRGHSDEGPELGPWRTVLAWLLSWDRFCKLLYNSCLFNEKHNMLVLAQQQLLVSAQHNMLVLTQHNKLVMVRK